MEETITIPRAEYQKMKEELKTLRNIKVYQRLLEFETNIVKDKEYSRKYLGF